MRPLVEALCSDECAGRAPGTPGGDRRAPDRRPGVPRRRARPRTSSRIAVRRERARRDAAETDRYVLVGAHFDHLGKDRPRHLPRRRRQRGRGRRPRRGRARARATSTAAAACIIAAFDGEEPPHFIPGDGLARCSCGPTVPRPIDFMVCMDLVGHRVRSAGRLRTRSATRVRARRRAERGNVRARVDRSSAPSPGVIVRPRGRRDHSAALRLRGRSGGSAIPFLFLSAGRSRVYHTPEDTPDKLD